MEWGPLPWLPLCFGVLGLCCLVTVKGGERHRVSIVSDLSARAEKGEPLPRARRQLRRAARNWRGREKFTFQSENQLQPRAKWDGTELRSDLCRRRRSWAAWSLSHLRNSDKFRSSAAGSRKHTMRRTSWWAQSGPPQRPGGFGPHQASFNLQALRTIYLIVCDWVQLRVIFPLNILNSILEWNHGAHRQTFQ